MKSQSMMLIAKRSFTLLEICIALLLLSLIASVCSIKIKDFIDQHRFNKSVATLVISLQEAQGLAVSYQSDFECDLFTKNGKRYYQIQTDSPLQLFDRTAHELSEVAFLKVNGKKQDHLKLNIYSGGRIEPSVLLKLYHKEGEERGLQIDLQTPLLIKFTSCQDSLGPSRSR